MNELKQSDAIVYFSPVIFIISRLSRMLYITQTCLSTRKNVKINQNYVMLSRA